MSEATALAQAAQQVYDAARSHKRSEAFHRKQARTLMQSLDELRRNCLELGITVTIIEAKETHVHGPRNTRPSHSR